MKSAERSVIYTTRPFSASLYSGLSTYSSTTSSSSSKTSLGSFSSHFRLIISVFKDDPENLHYFLKFTLAFGSSFIMNTYLISLVFHEKMTILKFWGSINLMSGIISQRDSALCYWLLRKFFCQLGDRSFHQGCSQTHQFGLLLPVP